MKFWSGGAWREFKCEITRQAKKASFASLQFEMTRFPPFSNESLQEGVSVRPSVRWSVGVSHTPVEFRRNGLDLNKIAPGR